MADAFFFLPLKPHLKAWFSWLIHSFLCSSTSIRLVPMAAERLVLINKRKTFQHIRRPGHFGQYIAFYLSGTSRVILASDTLLSIQAHLKA